VSPEKRQQRWMEAMKRGDYEAAWQETDALETGRRAGIREPHHLIWDGTPPDGRHVVVHCAHGLGDTIQFSRFLPELDRRASQVTLRLQPELHSLFRMQRAMGDIDSDEDSKGEVDVEIMELAYLFRSTIESIPPPALKIPRLDRHLVATGTPDFKVAIFWSASGWGSGRYIPLQTFDPLADVERTMFFSFQQGEHETDAAESGLPIVRMSAATGDLLALAQALLEMDLVISVDTMAAHLAGSLRRPVWLLLDPECDWRWIDNRSDSPWYPEMRIFRCRNDDWAPIIRAIRERLYNHEW
jgi:hypothetical protein